MADLAKRGLEARPFPFWVVAGTALTAPRLASAEIPWTIEDATLADINGGLGFACSDAAPSCARIDEV
jgi:hypothetical protein